MQIWAESGKSALPICNYSQILYQFLTFTQNLKRSRFFRKKTEQDSFPLCLIFFVTICCFIVKFDTYSSSEPLFFSDENYCTKHTQQNTDSDDEFFDSMLTVSMAVNPNSPSEAFLLPYPAV